MRSFSDTIKVKLYVVLTEGKIFCHLYQHSRADCPPFVSVIKENLFLTEGTFSNGAGKGAKGSNNV